MSITERNGGSGGAHWRPMRRAALASLLGGALLAGCAGTPEQPSATAPTLTGQPAAVDARTRAAEARAKGDTDLALRLYVEAADHDPTDAESLYEIGTLYDERGNGALAARAYARAVQIDPLHARALEGLGLRYFADRQFEEARPLLSRAAGHDPTLWRAHNALGLIADALGEHGDAVVHFAAALAANPGSAALLNNRGYSRYLSGSLDAAERDFRAALALDPSYDKALQNLGLVYARRGDYQAAVSTLTSVVGAPVAANDVGYIAMLSGDYSTAERLFQDAIRLSPRYYPMANENVAELRRRRATTPVAAQ
jgi:Flp pilus assembly protein TadD